MPDLLMLDARIVDTVFAMHQGPMPWEQVMGLIEKSRHA